MFIDTLTILNAMKALLLAMQLPSTYAAVANYPKAFTRVEIYRSESIYKAIEDMFLFGEDRICLLVPAGETYQDKIGGSVLDAQRTDDIVIL